MRTGAVITLRATVIGVDPGTTTGMFRVVLTAQINGHDSRVESDYHAWELKKHEVRDALLIQLDNDPSTLVALERYVITKRTARFTQQPDALLVSGLVIDACRSRGVSLLSQMKSDAGRMGNDGVLRSLGWYQRGMPHANDGARHALLALSAFEPVAFEVLMTRGRIDS